MKLKILKILRELEKTQKKFWNITPESGAFLNTLIKDRNYRCALEIGTSNGYSGIWLAEALSHTNGKLYTIESNAKNRFPLGTENFKKTGLKNIIQILGHAPEAIPKIPKYFDFAFFDATKCEHLSYFDALKNRIKKGGMVVTDNIHSHRNELKTYIATLKQYPDWHHEEIKLGTGLLLSFRK